MLDISNFLSLTRNSFLTVSISLAMYGILLNINEEDERLRMLFKVMISLILFYTLIIIAIVYMNMSMKSEAFFRYHIYMNVIVIPMLCFLILYLTMIV